MSTESFGLRPRNIGELLDLTYRCYRKGFATFAVVGIAIAVPNALLSGLSQAWLFSSATMAGMDSTDPSAGLAAIAMLYAWMFAMGLIGIVIYSLGVLTIYAATEDVLLGRPTSIGAAFEKSWRRFPASLGTSFIVTFLTGIAALLCCLPAVPVLITLILAIPLVYLERLGPISAISRSYDLVWKRGPGGLDIEANWVRVLVVGLITGMVFYVLSFVAGMPLLIATVFSGLQDPQLTQGPMGPAVVPLHIQLPLQTIGAVINGALVSIVVIPWPLVYYDIRTRHEGLDLEMQAGELAAGIGDGADP